MRRFLIIWVIPLVLIQAQAGSGMAQSDSTPGSAPTSLSQPEETAEALPLAEVTADPTDPDPEQTLSPEASRTPDISQTPAPSWPSSMGWVRYQNRGIDHSGIVVALYVDDVLIEQVETAADGAYELALPPEGDFRLIFDAPLHRSEMRFLTALTALPSLILLAGDLNEDGCIDRLDLDLMSIAMASPEGADLNGDGLTDAADIALMAANVDAECAAARAESASATPTPEYSATPTLEYSATPTLEYSATPTAEHSATPSPEHSATPTAEHSATPTAEHSATPSPTVSATPSPTMSATPSPTMSATASPTVSATPATAKPEETAEISG